MKYKTPFRLENGIVRDADGKTVKLWGVNYYAPFNHNYFNILELGKDHFAAIDEDFRHFKLMGIDFIRMHLYDREISDPYGNLVDNHQLEVLDYLIDRAEQEGIFLMITPIVWWNTVSNQIQLDQAYAYWHIGTQQAFGFSNFFSKDSLLWDEDALACQKRYFESLFAHRNKFSGRRLDEYSNIAAIELCNEMQTPRLDMLTDPETFDRNRSSAWEYSRGEQLRKLVKIWREYKKDKTGTDREILAQFNCEHLVNYGKTMMEIVNRYFGNRTLKAMFGSYAGYLSAGDLKLFREIGVDLPTLGTYLNFDGFDSTNTDRFNHLTKAREWLEYVRDVSYGGFGKAVYEFDATGTQNGYPYAALAAAYAKFGVQMAAYFTYTPAAVAAWNPGWLVHYMSLEHTPRKAAAFAAAGEIFRGMSPESELDMQEGEWSGNGFRILRDGDAVTYRDGTRFLFSNPTDAAPENPETLESVTGHGGSPVAECSGNGCFFLKRQSAKVWTLELMHDQAYIADPGRGKCYRGMANRYISCLSNPPVSLLYERKVRFRFKLGKVVSCLAEDGKNIPPETDGSLELAAGSYTLTLE